jgi:sensor histidine kinase YesM
LTFLRNLIFTIKMVFLYTLLITIFSVVTLIAIRKIQSNRKEYLATALILLIVGCVMTILVCRSCTETLSIFVKASTFFSATWIFLWLGNAFFSEWISQRISWTAQPIRMFIILLVFTIGYTLIAVYLILFFYNHVMGFNLKASDMIYSSLVITFLISLFLHGRSFLLSWRQSAIDAEKLKHESVTARYESLKSQVNPHFLFNSLNALSNLVHEDASKAEQFIKQLADVYRYVLDTRGKELVPVQEELAFLKSYVYLQQIRFGDKLHIEIDLDNTSGMVAPLALQMLVENAIKHNEVSEEKPLTIRIYEKQHAMVVENTLQKKNILPEAPYGMGLENIRKRYEFLSKQPVEVIQSDSVFAVSLPLIEMS